MDDRAMDRTLASGAGAAGRRPGKGARPAIRWAHWATGVLGLSWIVIGTASAITGSSLLAYVSVACAVLMGVSVLLARRIEHGARARVRSTAQTAAAAADAQGRMTLVWHGPDVAAGDRLLLRVAGEPVQRFRVVAWLGHCSVELVADPESRRERVVRVIGERLRWVRYRWWGLTWQLRRQLVRLLRSVQDWWWSRHGPPPPGRWEQWQAIEELGQLLRAFVARPPAAQEWDEPETIAETTDEGEEQAPW